MFYFIRAKMYVPAKLVNIAAKFWPKFPTRLIIARLETSRCEISLAWNKNVIIPPNVSLATGGQVSSLSRFTAIPMQKAITHVVNNYFCSAADAQKVAAFKCC